MVHCEGGGHRQWKGQIRVNTKDKGHKKITHLCHDAIIFLCFAKRCIFTPSLSLGNSTFCNRNLPIKVQDRLWCFPWRGSKPVAAPDNGASWRCCLDAWMCGWGCRDRGCNHFREGKHLSLIDRSWRKPASRLTFASSVSLHPFAMSQNESCVQVLVQTMTLFFCSFSKATSTTTPTRRMSLSPRSTPDTCACSRGSGTSASLCAWSCWAATTRRWRWLTVLTVLRFLHRQQRSRGSSVSTTVCVFATTMIWLTAGTLTHEALS